MKSSRVFVLSLAILALMIGSDLMGQKLSEDFLSHFHYREIGPTRQGGRITAIAVPDTDKKPFTFYIGASLGGVWKTTDNGITYKPVFDNESTLAIGDIAVANSDPNTVWVGTGEANGGYYGNGIYKSINGGESWKNMGLPESHYIGRIKI